MLWIQYLYFILFWVLENLSISIIKLFEKCWMKFWFLFSSILCLQIRQQKYKNVFSIKLFFIVSQYFLVIRFCALLLLYIYIYCSIYNLDPFIPSTVFMSLILWSGLPHGKWTHIYLLTIKAHLRIVIYDDNPQTDYNH